MIKITTGSLIGGMGSRPSPYARESVTRSPPVVCLSAMRCSHSRRQRYAWTRYRMPIQRIACRRSARNTASIDRVRVEGKTELSPHPGGCQGASPGYSGHLQPISGCLTGSPGPRSCPMRLPGARRQDVQPTWYSLSWQREDTRSSPTQHARSAVHWHLNGHGDAQG
jgi:hypothetical protein